MKKNTLTLFTICAVTAICTTAFSLPLMAKQQFNAKNGAVNEKPAPQEYMNDFTVSEITQEESRIFLTEEQLSTMKISAEKTFRKLFSIHFPSSLLFEYKTEKVIDTNDVYVDLYWKQGEETVGQAMFKVLDFPKNQPELMSIFATEYFSETILDSFQQLIKEAFQKELGYKVDEAFSKSYRLSAFVGQDDYIRPSIELILNWYNESEKDGKDIMEGYQAIFGDVDMQTRSGCIKSLVKFTDDLENPTNGKQQKLAEIPFSETEQNEMLEAARAFLLEKGLQVGGLRTSTPSDLNTALSFRFDVENEEGGYQTATVIIMPNLKILGYII